MNVTIRVDSSLELGTGHAVRCLALAEAIRLQGGRCRFVSARATPWVERAIRAAGHELVGIECPDWAAPSSGLAWSADLQLGDAAATLAAAPDSRWVVVDHYGLDAIWERTVRAEGQLCLAIDDLGRLHACDLLLDQTLHADAEARYRDSTAGQRLLGPRFALLRPGFADAHRSATVREAAVRRLFLMMSGSDPLDMTGLALDAVEQAGLSDVVVDVVTGSAHPKLDTLRSRVARHPGWTLQIDTDRVHELMLGADLAIGAGGTATWERCALGLPTLALEIAENQRDLLREAALAGLLHAVPGPPDAARLAAHLGVLAESGALRALISRRALAAVDGRGALRVAAAMRPADIELRPATPDDSAALLAWRNAPAVRASSRSADPIAPAAHKAWFQSVLESPDRHLLIGERTGNAVGVVRFDRLGVDSAEVSIYLTPSARPGDGTPLLRAAESWLKAVEPGIRSIIAEILPGNQRSEEVFARAGYRPQRSVHAKELAP
jgi:UDP-2,4-diacetamido-2,4,6-trideoxy-beta-L-altropyranose hydrolase